jgi:hypothetical protein
MKQGAFEYLVKPIDADRLTQVIERAFAAAKLMRVPALLPTDARPDRIIGRSPIMQEMSKAIGRAAPWDVNVLILGETGAGKELVHHSPRANKPFLAINCAAIPENLLESELFGHEEGAFTGALRRRVGKFEQCSGGTLFLDEIGDMALPLQTKLLRVLQEHEFEPIGGNRVVKSQVRVLAATNQDLEIAMAQGRFRKDRSPIIFSFRFAKTCAATSAATPPRHWDCSSTTIGPATCASFKEPSSKPCSVRRGPSSKRATFPKRSAKRAPRRTLKRPMATKLWTWSLSSSVF